MATHRNADTSVFCLTFLFPSSQVLGRLRGGEVWALQRRITFGRRRVRKVGRFANRLSFCLACFNLYHLHFLAFQHTCMHSFHALLVIGTWSRWIKTTSASVFNYSQTGLTFAWGTSRFVGWIILTTSFLTLLPLVLEVKREERVEELVSGL